MFIDHFLGTTPSGPQKGTVGVLDGLMGEAAREPPKQEGRAVHLWSLRALQDKIKGIK